MSLDNTINLERIATAFERIAAALEARNRIELDRLAKLFPPEKEKRAAEILDPKQDKRKQYSDRADSDWFDETEAALPKSRFQEKYDQTNPPRTGEKRRRAVEVPQKQ